MPTAILPLGRLVATPGALQALEESGQSPLDFASQHATGNWGTVDAEDWQANNRAVIEGSRVLSCYVTLKAKTIWIISEADRSVTTLLLPSEY